MGKWNKYIPEGMQDLIFEDCSIKRDIESKLRDLYIKSGFSEVISPGLEFYDVFSTEHQYIEQEKMYKFFDNQGRILVLRPDMTTPIGRIVATKLKDSVKPIKLFYNANIFRINERLNGKVGEITQSGIEIIGSESIKSDAEVIITAINSLKSVGLNDFKIEIGQANFYKSLIKDIPFENSESEELRKHIENKNFAELEKFLKDKNHILKDDNIEVLNKLPQLFGDKEVLEIAKGMTDNEGALKSIENIENVISILESVGLSNYVLIDLGMLHQINYYTGIIFKAYSSEIGEEILSGGRYDNLVGNFGYEMPATGFAANVDNISLALKKQNKYTEKETKYLIHYKKENLKKCYEIASIIRENDFIAEISLMEDEVQSLNYAKKKDINYMIDFKDDKLIIYNIKNNEKTILDKEQFISSL